MKTIESESDAEGYRSALDGMHTSLGSGTMGSNGDSDSQIAAFYVGKSIFITGATGFMGKVNEKE